MTLSSFADVHAALKDYWPRTTTRHRYGLDHMYRLLEHLGNPQDRLKVIHVAGTSGKTSTAYYAAALLKAAGKQVGLTISPHVDEVNERVQINLTPLPEKEFAERFGQYLALVKTSGVTPNYFELFIAFAFWEFAARKVEYAVVEVGIGGLLDSSNVIAREDKVCIITDIGLDHTEVLGNTLAEIAEQKAGIITLHNAVFCYRQSGDITSVFVHRAAVSQADLHMLTGVPAAAQLDFLPLFQQRNFGLALTALQFLFERDALPPLGKKAMLAAARTYIPARMETYQLGDKILLLDCAHNQQKFHGLLTSVYARYGVQPIAVLVRLGVPEGRGHTRLSGSMQELVTGLQHIIITSLSEGFKPDRRFKPQLVAEVCKQVGYDSFEVLPNPRTAFLALMKRPEPIVIVAGSFLLLNHIRPLVRQQQLQETLDFKGGA